MKTIALPLIAAAALAGCGTLGPSAEQIKAAEGTASSQCIQSLLYGTAHFTTFGGKSTGTAGGGGTAKCGSSEVVFANEGKAPAKAAP